jgi:hypothetical protein
MSSVSSLSTWLLIFCFIVFCAETHGYYRRGRFSPRGYKASYRRSGYNRMSSRVGEGHRGVGQNVTPRSRDFTPPSPNKDINLGGIVMFGKYFLEEKKFDKKVQMTLLRNIA